MMSDVYCIVTPYNSAKPDEAGKKYLVKLPTRKYLEVGDLVVCAGPSGREAIYSAVTPDFNSAGGDIMTKWGMTPETIWTVVATLLRSDIDIVDDRVMREEPTIE